VKFLVIPGPYTIGIVIVVPGAPVNAFPFFGVIITFTVFLSVPCSFVTVYTSSSSLKGIDISVGIIYCKLTPSKY
jgi:hypothetical protein